MILTRGLLLSVWLSLVVAIPIPQGGSEGGSKSGNQGSGKSAAASDGNGNDSVEFDSVLSIPAPNDPLSGALQPTTGGYQRTTAQTRQTNPQTLGGSPLNGLTNGENAAGGQGLDTSLRKLFSGGSPIDTGRRDSNNPSTLNGRLAPPGIFSQIPAQEQVGRSPGWEYVERLPPDGSLSASIKFPAQTQLQEQTKLSTPFNSNPPSVRLAGQEWIYRDNMKPGYTYSRQQYVPQNTTPLGSSRFVNYTPLNKYKTSSTFRASPQQTLRRGEGGEEQQEEAEKRDFIESYRSQYPDFAETIEYIEDDDRNMSPEKKLLEQFGFPIGTTPRIQVPQLANVGGAAGGKREQIRDPDFIRAGNRQESDLLPGDLGNVLAQFEDSNDDEVDITGNPVGTKASCDVTDFDCVDGETLPLAAQVTRDRGTFEVRNPGRVGGMTQRADANRIASIEWSPPLPGFGEARDQQYRKQDVPPLGFGGYQNPNKRGPQMTVASHMWPPQ